MTHAKHTPGPWLVSYERGTTQIRCANGESIMGDETFYPWVPENDADWHLIAAAPDLLPIADLVAALPVSEEVADDVPVTGVNGVYITHGDVRAARAAIAKAKGETT